MNLSKRKKRLKTTTRKLWWKKIIEDVVEKQLKNEEDLKWLPFSENARKEYFNTINPLGRIINHTGTCNTKFLWFKNTKK